ncbi:MAG: endo alpha-1,4 polygalactosaminidase [Pseudomonadota bacterium]|nr:endo alpha-1,4 polygalactosaminidase [Pseudomonadota bacterium]
MTNPLSGAASWLYHLGDVNRARAAEIAAQDPDLVVTEWASYAREEAPYGDRILDALREGDPERLVVSYISIGEAEPYRYYWRKAWETSPPAWLDEVNPEWVDNIRVKYWMADWQEIVFDYADRIFEAGFDGLYLDIVSAYEYFEEVAPRARDYRADMVAFVAALRERADDWTEATGRTRVVIAQNAEELIEEAGYADIVHGIAREDMRFYYEYGRAGQFEAQPVGEYRYALNLLKEAEAQGVETFAVEYIPEAQETKAAAALEAEADDLAAAGIPLYVAGGRDLDEVYAQPGGGDGSQTPPGDPDPGGWIEGGARGDEIDGTRRDDRIRGLGGADELEGLGGDDLLVGGRGGDALLGGGGNDRLTGGAGADELYGGRGRDRLAGGGGDDWLDGGDGLDRLTGGRGADVFVLSAGRDRVRDFDPDEDEIAMISDDGVGQGFRLRETAKGVMVTGDDGERMLLEGIARGALDADHFFFDL